MNWHELLNIGISDAYVLTVAIGPLSILISFAFFLFGVFVFKRRRTRSRSWHAVEAQIKLGNYGHVVIRPNHEVIQLAHQAWTEMITRKAALPFDESNDVIIEVYKSWYALFQEIRRIIKDVPADKIRKCEDTRKLVEILVQSLNLGLRPHLTKWQAKYRAWLDYQSSANFSPQDLQKQYPYFSELAAELKKTNGDLLDYALFLKELAHGKT